LATAFEGERFLKFVKINSSTPGTLYTCPAGRYASVNVSKFTVTPSSTVSIGAVSHTEGGSSVTVTFSRIDPQAALNFVVYAPIILGPGETIVITGGGSVNANVLEFEAKNL